MFEFFSRLFSTQQFMPHGHCFLWLPDVLWLHVVSDMVIAISYYSIPIALIYFASKRPDVNFRWLLLLFGAFICLCGTTHVISIITMWEPVYRLEGMFKALTAIVSLITAILLWPLLPKALKIPSPGQLLVVNAELIKEINSRKKIESELLTLNNLLHKQINDRKLAEERLLEYAHKLEQSNEELQNFAHVASHDLQEPLRKIQLFGDRLETRESENLDDAGRQCIVRMRESASKMSNLISDMLDYARVTTHSQPHLAVNLNDLAADVISDLEASISETSGSITVEDLPTIMGDPRQMRQLLQNLLSNALKFHRPKSQPIIRVYAETIAEESQACRLFVEDNGIGFDEKYLNKIFTPFQRLHTTGEFEGTGIGLAVCRKIAERHHGSITAISRIGHGSQFIVTLNARPENTSDDELTTNNFVVVT